MNNLVSYTTYKHLHLDTLSIEANITMRRKLGDSDRLAQ